LQSSWLSCLSKVLSSSRFFPAGQSKQPIVIVAFANFPAPHTKQGSVPAFGLCFPFTHGVHIPSLAVDPVRSCPYADAEVSSCPALHEEFVIERHSLLLQYLPVEHLVQHRAAVHEMLDGDGPHSVSD
jgi:hypothetical protein